METSHRSRVQKSGPDPTSSYYYVGVLSAAELHGAAHQRPQVFQVVTGSPTWPLHVGGMRIEFLTKKNISEIPTQQMKTPTGFIRVSTPEATAVDVVRYYRAAGYFDNVATVLIELAEVLDSKKLAAAARAQDESSTAQRLGFLLDTYSKERPTRDLAKWVHRQRPKPVPLSPCSRRTNEKPDKKWSVIPNIKIEPGL